ncbi:alpha/beta hydrolase [Clostridium novyi A str. 4570]|uniref:Alpha/beta hydrolase n=1 Tax=Clostridium novyi A str. 4570 TaxID=1444290 RepID=A0AA88ZID0_CLONO|nr:hypothetical protein [Clostridium novyi]KGM99632.1 alpha/beta hydrolase [Clostridium novyi A str. 4570]
MSVIQNNCERCTEYKNNRCDTKVTDCMCKGCPRNLGECLITRYCRETESVICNDDEYYY